jgi:hypothetical protein
MYSAIKMRLLVLVGVDGVTLAKLGNATKENALVAINALANLIIDILINLCIKFKVGEPAT